MEPAHRRALERVVRSVWLASGAFTFLMVGMLSWVGTRLPQPDTRLQRGDQVPLEGECHRIVAGAGNCNTCLRLAEALPEGLTWVVPEDQPGNPRLGDFVVDPGLFDALRVNGIPTAFVVMDGTVRWLGSPSRVPVPRCEVLR